MSKKAKAYKVETEDVAHNTDEYIRGISQNLKPCAVLSDEWLFVATNLENLSKLSYLEGSEQTEESKVELGKNVTGTLWDSSKVTNTLRILAEEKKVSVIVSLLSDYKDWLKSPTTQQEINDCANKHFRTFQEIISKINQFECDAGNLLKRLFEYPESFQLCNTDELLEHIAKVIRSVLDQTSSTDLIDIRQESLVFHYLYEIADKLSSLEKGSLVAKIKQMNIPKNACKVFLSHHEIYDSLNKLKILEFLGTVADLEEFEDYEFLTSPQEKETLVALRRDLIRDLIVEYPERRPIVRPFLDVIENYERELRFK
mmetsp:Transcript_9327/g.13878  ORF Transcript_9327/g.13878 Transcript_9327/m.13878 type:complete len:314 (+) Transcript_9327:826-1767(+)